MAIPSAVTECCCYPEPEIVRETPTASEDTPWCGGDKKLYLTSGQFSSTIKTSQGVGGTFNLLAISWDGTNTPWAASGGSHDMFLTSGQFTSTVKTSESVGGAANIDALGISWDGTNTPTSGRTNLSTQKVYLTSGQFTTTLKTSQGVSGIQGVSYASGDTPRCSTSKLFLQSGQFTSTIKTSLSVVGTSSNDISWDGTNTPWVRIGATDKLYLQSGQFTSTIKTSQDISIVDTNPSGINTNKLTTG